LINANTCANVTDIQDFRQVAAIKLYTSRWTYCARRLSLLLLVFPFFFFFPFFLLLLLGWGLHRAASKWYS
jgi:hypothetical protein